MFKYEMVGRKPAKYNVEFEGRTGIVFQTGDPTRSKRWHLDGVSYDESRDFQSRRAAFHYFKTGEKHTTKPVFQVLGGRKGQKRIR